MDYINNRKDNLIQDGDVCVVYISDNDKSIFEISPNSICQTKFGHIKGVNLIGHEYGIKYNCSKGWIIPLRLTPELWTQLLPHRTQILYQADISLILFQLDIKTDSIVVESGTGSGSLSHAILRACRPNGYLYTFDINDIRVEQARKEFETHGFGKYVTVGKRDICDVGYEDSLLDKADACILDLPRTWDAIEHAFKVLKSNGGRLCAFSPCIEQVQRNVEKMQELKMHDITTVETNISHYMVREESLRVWDESFLDKLVEIDSIKFGGQTENQNTGDQEKLRFHPKSLPTKSRFEMKKQKTSSGHSGYLTFAIKRC